MDQVIGAVMGVLSSGTTSLILKGLLLVGAAIFTIWLKAKYDAWQIAQARKAEAAKEIADKQKIIDDNKKQNDEAKLDSSAIDEALKKMKGSQ